MWESSSEIEAARVSRMQGRNREERGSRRSPAALWQRQSAAEAGSDGCWYQAAAEAMMARERRRGSTGSERSDMEEKPE
jgi:hypothetical protein